MLERTHIPEAPWWVVEANDKKRARLNCIAHLLTRIPYQEVPYEKPILPKRALPRLSPDPGSERDVRARPLREPHESHFTALSVSQEEKKVSRGPRVTGVRW
jgi:Polyphosphate kinase 2 (PPK2)